MAFLGLRRRTEDRWVQAVGFAQPLAESLAGQGAVLTVFLPRRAREIAAHDALDREHGSATAKHRSTLQFLLVIAKLWHFANDLGRVRRQHVVVDLALGLAQPPCRD